MPEFSIIVPIYKVEKYLEICIDSIIGQSFCNFELILVDDGSPDTCGEICDRYSSSDTRVKVVHKENGGLSSARNAGLDIATGKYVIFIDSDDFWDDARGIEAIHIEKDRFQLIYNTYMHSDSEMSVLCNHTIAFQNNHMKEEWSRPYKLGYESFGPLLFGFSKWLKENVVKEKIDKIFFLSRDGKIMKRAFDIYDSDHETDSNYFLASRRALQVPKLVEEKNIKDILGFIYFPSELTIESLLRKLGIDDDNIVDSVCKKIEKRKDTIIAKKDLDGILGNKIWNEAVYYIKKNAENERKSFIGYLNQEQFSGRVAIVDIGWFGNMQSNIESIIKQDQIPANVYGYYVALAPDGKHQKHLNMKGYL